MRGFWLVCEVLTMIRLTRLDGEAFLLNAELIKYVESRPDTFITLTTGDRVVAEQSPDEVLRLVVEYQQSKNLTPSPPSRAGLADPGGLAGPYDR